MKLMRATSRVLRKIANQLDRVSTQSLYSGIKIHPTSELNYENLCIKLDCSITIDEQSRVTGKLAFDRNHASILIGKRVFMSGYLIAAKHIEIGDDVLISWGVTILDHDSHAIAFSQRSQDVLDWQEGKKNWESVKTAPVKISNKVWIGFNSIILKGVTIGEGAVVGAGAVVTKDIPSWSVVAGNPARVIREIPEHER